MAGPVVTQVARSVPFDNDNNAYPSSDTSVQDALESVPLRMYVSDQATSNSNLALTKNSPYVLIFTGSVSGQIITLPDATTLKAPGFRYEIWNISSTNISIKDFVGGAIDVIHPNTRAWILLRDKSTPQGVWLMGSSPTGDIAVDFTNTKQAFEDFMFDAYAGAGGNDNQYSFTPAANSGSSNIDGAVPAAGNDYEGIHILDSLTCATARPLLDGFNGVNRIKLGAQLEAYEIRVRIENLATTAQKFTTRYGLMDVSTVGIPANGVIFSYDPVYPVTPVAQVVTVTPVVTSKAPTQVFTETLNGTPFTYTYTTKKTIQLTTWTRANNTLYTVTINGTPCNYTSDSTATDAEIATGLANAINTNVGGTVTAVTTGGTKPVIITANTVGADFTWSTSAKITSVDNTATPVATTVVSNLISSINADGPLPVTASGTTTLILTADTPGTPFTYSGTSKLTNVLTTPNVVEVLYSGNWICSVINSSTVTSVNSGVAVVADQWYKLKAIISADGSSVLYYINNALVGTITTAVPTTPVRFIFKLEKTLGTVSRTTSIDYIAWNRDRG